MPSAANLESAIESTVEKLNRDIDDLEVIPDFEDGCVGLYREANALAALAGALGASDEDSTLKAVVPALIAAARKAASAKDVDEAKAARDEIVAAIAKRAASPVAADPLKPAKVAALRPLMKNAVPALTTEIKRLGRNEKTLLRGTNARKVVDNSTALVAIAFACAENVDETLAPNEEKIWREYCDRLQTAALDYNRKVGAVVEKTGDFAEASAAFKTLEATCSSTCHETFGGKASE